MDDVFENKPLYHNYQANPGKSLQGKTSLTKNNILRKHITNIQIFFTTHLIKLCMRVIESKSIQFRFIKGRRDKEFKHSFCGIRILIRMQFPLCI